MLCHDKSVGNLRLSGHILPWQLNGLERGSEQFAIYLTIYEIMGQL